MASDDASARGAQLDGQGKASSFDSSFAVAPPSLSLPKGGGAIRGIGEKFAANPVTGTGSMSVPIATSPARSGFGPQLSLTYDSGAGNGPFGMGWNLSLASITRKTDKGLPQYRDADESDVFILSGAEDLVPVLLPDGRRSADENTAPGYVIHGYRPRIEGLFARIERWTRLHDGDTHWRSISRDNVLTLYGSDAESRIADPQDAGRVFSWLLCETRDDKGNAVRYRYKSEDGSNVDLGRASERNRGARDDVRRSANRYLKRVQYGNRTTLLDDAGQRPRFLTDLPPAQVQNIEWLFELVFDFGEHDALAPTTGDDLQQGADGAPKHPWPSRADAFSSYRPGFELRTTRLCRRALMFHHFEGQEGVGRDCLVRSTDFSYSAEQDQGDAGNPIYSFLLSVTQTGYRRSGTGYVQRSMPPVEFEYSRPVVQDAVHDVDPQSLENLPAGVDGSAYQWTDLHGEGIPGILTEQARAWFYKRNLSPIGKQPVEFAPIECVATKPRAGVAGAQARFMDLAGDGQPDLVVLDPATPGLYEHDEEEGWQPFRPFTSWLGRNLNDPNVRLVDLDGDGHADVLITEDEAFVWHASLGEHGFGPARRVAQALDEEKGPRLVFADGTQSIYLADMSGDGLTDLVRIGNEEVCYWPNLGYCRFGAKVCMDRALPAGNPDEPAHFDNPDQFDQRRIRLADIDGSGTTDIIYLHRDGIRLYFNQSGNGLSAPQTLRVCPRVDDVVSIAPADLLGNGTACLVWSSPLPTDWCRQMRYVDLMGGQKPHLLVKARNNLGAETTVEYAPSTRFYLQDRRAGRPWRSKLPFPVHVVERVTVTDKWRKMRFSTSYTYHHGHYDGIEREFRGFGRIERVDTESYGHFAAQNSPSPFVTQDKTLYQPPVKTITWYHTGGFMEQERILTDFEDEYFPHSLASADRNGFEECRLPEPDLNDEDLGPEEWREAVRACKGTMLRQEVYELDVAGLELQQIPEHRRVKLFSAARRNCRIRCLQRQGMNRHAVFLVTESESLTYQYELDLTTPVLTPDPRVTHAMKLNFDEQGNVLQEVSIAYPRAGKFENDVALAAGLAGALPRIHAVQQELHLAYTEKRYSRDFGAQPADAELARDNHRLRVPCEVLTYELTGLRPDGPDDHTSMEKRYFTMDEVRRFRLSMVLQAAGEPVQEIAYHQVPGQAVPTKRVVEHARTLFFSPNLVDPLPFGEHGLLGVVYENYKLALTDSLLDAVFKEDGHIKLDEVIDDAGSARARLDRPVHSGYLSGADLVARFATVPPAELAGQYWARSGIAGFAPDASQHFYLPERYTDAFRNVSTVDYDEKYDLFVEAGSDPHGNTTRVTRFDYRVLAPREMRDINDNLSEVFFDVLGLPIAVALKGKGNEGDRLAGFDSTPANAARTEPDRTALRKFFDAADLDEVQARAWLGDATSRHIYDFGETEQQLAGRPPVTLWAQHPACACGIAREQHVSQLAPGAQSPIQATFEYSDGTGSVIVKKVQAEPESAGQPLRWVASGKTVLNNKGKPVKQYEPYFSSPDVGHRYEEPEDVGVTSVIYYDAVGRTVRTDVPDGSYSRSEFSPWHVRSFDANDTVKEEGNAWFARKTAASATPDDQRAAQLAAEHAGTPALAVLDSLGREVIAIAHNRVRDAGGVLQDEKYLTFTRLDAEGKPLWIRDARGNLVMQYVRLPVPSDLQADPVAYSPCYDIAGNLLFQRSMDAGDRWMLPDAAGKSMIVWNSRGHTLRTDYDALQRPTGGFVKGADPGDANRIAQFDKLIYGDTPGNDLTDARKIQLNLRGKPYRHHDTAGLMVSMGRDPMTGAEEAFDFKGNPLRSTRQLAVDYKATPDWSQNPALDAETFTSSSRFDALNRPIQLVAPHSDRAGAKINVSRPGYNAANLLERVDVWLELPAEPVGLLDPATANLNAVSGIDYDAKGQRVRIDYNEAGHPIVTRYTYDKDTFRLTRLLSTRPAHAEAGKRTLQDLGYSYDPVGNITAVRDAAQQTVFFDNSTIEPRAAYTYDALYRLVGAEGREHAAQNNVQRDAQKFEPDIGIPFPNSPEALQRYREDYEYDAVGNIMAMQHTGGAVQRWVRRYQYALDSNRLISTRLPADPAKLPPYAAAPGYGAKYVHDRHGNMTAMPHLALMEWDFKDQLHATQQQVANAGPGEKTWYVYDAGGQRIRKVTEGQNGTRQHERIYLGGLEIYRKSTGNPQEVALERESLHVMDGKQRVALVETRTRLQAGADPAPRQIVRFQLGNHLGSAMLELDGQAMLISYEEYHPYGTTAYQSARSVAETPGRYRYTGKERDEETGFSYHGARYCAPWLGRWVSCDPLGVADGPNIFQYGQCNPVRYVDPTGTDCMTHLGYDPENRVANPTTCSTDAYAGSSVPQASLSGPSAIKSRSAPVATAPPPSKPAHRASPRPTMSDAESMEKLKAVAQQLQPTLTYPKGITRAMGVGQTVGGVLELGAAVYTVETGVGPMLLGAHGIDTIQTGLRTAWTGEQKRSGLFYAGSGAAFLFTDDPKLASAVGSTTDMAGNMAAGAYSFKMTPAPVLSIAPEAAEAGLVSQTLEQASYLKAGGAHPEAAIGKGNQVLAGVRDTVTGESSFGRSAEGAAENLYPALKQEYDPWRALIEGDKTYARLGPPGAHGEINALNRALWARDPTGLALTAADFGSFEMTAVWLGKGGPYVMPRCPTCWFMTPNVRYLGPVGPMKPVF